MTRQGLAPAPPPRLVPIEQHHRDLEQGVGRGVEARGLDVHHHRQEAAEPAVDRVGSFLHSSLREGGPRRAVACPRAARRLPYPADVDRVLARVPRGPGGRRDAGGRREREWSPRIQPQTGHDVDPAETEEWLESLEAVLERDGVPRAHFLIENLIAEARRAGANLPYSANTAYLNTIPEARERHNPRRSLDRVADPLAGAVERDGDGGAGEPGERRARRPHRELRLRRHPVRGRVQPLLARADPRARRRPRLHPGPLRARHLRARVPGGPAPGGGPPPLPPGGGREGTLLLSPPVAHALVLAVPDRVDGPRAHPGDLPRPVHALPRQPGPPQHRGAQGVVLRRGRGDGRARVARRDHPRGPGAARQPRLRRQLQPAAPRRPPGAGQRQDHPGARGGVPGSGLERHQGDLGLVLGRPPHARHQGPASPAHGGGGRRGVPELQGQGRRLYPRVLLREVSRAQADGRQHERRRHLAPQPGGARPPQGLRRIRPGGRPPRASPPSSSRRR